MRNFSKSLNAKNIDKRVSDVRIRIRLPFESSFWMSVSGCKLTILPDIQPANRIVIISGTEIIHHRRTWSHGTEGWKDVSEDNKWMIMQQLQALALQQAFWGISCLVLLPSSCNDSSLDSLFSKLSSHSSNQHQANQSQCIA